MPRPTQHLAEIERFSGSGNATEELRTILNDGLFALDAKKRADRIAERGTADKKNPHISDAGKCIRAVTYSLMNEEPSDPFTADSLMNFLVGTAVEEAWAKILTAAGAEFVREEHVSIAVNGTVVTGRKDFDGIRLLWHGNIVELKSINSRSMGWMLKKKQEGKDDHRRQLNLYLFSAGVPSGYLVYLVKDATKGEPILHAYRVDLNEELAKDDLALMADAHKMARENFLPLIPEDFKQTAYPCTYCQFRTKCWLTASTEFAETIEATT